MPVCDKGTSMNKLPLHRPRLLYSYSFSVCIPQEIHIIVNLKLPPTLHHFQKVVCHLPSSVTIEMALEINITE